MISFFSFFLFSERAVRGGGGGALPDFLFIYFFPVQQTTSLRDDFKAFGALHGSTPSDRRTFGVDRLVWTEAARKGEGAPWYTGVLLGAERFMASWHKSEEEASKLREVNRAA